MAEKKHDVVGVGNAIVDVLAKANDDFLDTHAIPKGGMVLIEETQAATIYDAMGAAVEISGGSAANTVACVASYGGSGGFIGKVADDALGEIFRHDLKAMGVAFTAPPLNDGPSTARCLIHVTPDAQRSMTTFLGAAGYVSKADLDADMIASADTLYFEGYLFEQPVAREAFVAACAIARENGVRTALTLSDAGVVERQHEALLDFIPQHIDLLFANDMEAQALFGVDALSDMAEPANRMCPLTAVTCSEKGSLIFSREADPVKVEAIAPDKLVDTTGAGDAYAAGLLFGLARNKPLEVAGALGSLAASEVISHFGARPEKSLESLGAEKGLL
ncbi:MAG: adenosine kinase [Pseudomonadota bacterium]